MRKAVIFASFLLFLLLTAHAQDPYEYYYNNSPQSDHAPEISSDMELFLIQLRAQGDIFRLLSEFNFSSVKYSRRGYGNRSSDYWGNIRLAGLVSPMPDYAALTLLKRSGLGRAAYSGLAHGEFNLGLVSDISEYATDVRSLIREGYRFSFSAHNRKGVGGAKVEVGGEFSNKFYGGASYSGKFGTDGFVKGVFTNDNTILAGLDWTLAADHRISLIAYLSDTEDGLRSYAVDETFKLTGDNYYNPSWGYYGGEKRSSRTISKLNGILMLNYEGMVSSSTSLNSTVSYRKGHEKRGGIGWFNAQTPYPDYYRYLPGYEPWNIADSWKNNDARVTQIFWDQLVEQNLNRSEQAAYIFEKRVEDIDYLQFALTAQTQIHQRFKLRYGLKLHYDTRLYYKELASLLGANPMRDIDQFLMDDDIFGEMHLNNMRDPNRVVGEGDKFGYDYRFTVMQTEVYAMLNYTVERFRLNCGLEVGQSRLQREGYYEKEILPSNGSYGLSRRYVFNTYTMKVSAGYSFSAQHFVDFSGIIAETAPYAGNLYLNPNYSNAVIENPTNVKTIGTETTYSMVTKSFNLTMSAFATKSSNETSIYRYWDDIASAYSDMCVSGVGKLYYGAEIAGDWTLSPRFSFRLAASLGSYTYNSNPTVNITDNATRNIIASNSKSYLKDFRLATAPEHAATGEIRYSSWGWLASLTANYMGGRYVDITPLRRMERAYGLAESAEKHHDFIKQERLGDAFTMNLFLLKSFSLKRGNLTATLSINNLLGNTNIVYNGYEQMRIAKRGTAPNYNWKPFPSKYLYSYGRTYYFSLSYSF